MPSLKSIIITAGLLVLVVLGTVLVRAALVTSTQLEAAPVSPVPVPVPVDVDHAARRLAGAIRYRTVSHRDPSQVDGMQFILLHRYLEVSFPNVHAVLDREAVADYSLLYTWTGAEPGLSPIVLMAHMDVVPGTAGEAGDWTHPPFEGRIADGFVWGRGAMDMKLAMMAALEAVEILVGLDFHPRRTVYLAFGHDEEIGGLEGAAGIAARLQERGVRAAFTLDEGSAIVEGIVPGVVAPVALVGLAEKGYVNVELAVSGAGGHSSRPEHPTTIGRLARAIHRLESEPMPASLRAPASGIFDALAAEMPFGMRVVVANRWLFEPLLVSRLARAPATNAIVRTTTAPTMVPAIGVKENVIPRQARAIVNFRILPGDTVQGVLDRAVAIIDDPDVAVTQLGEAVAPSPVSDRDSSEFATLHRTIREVFPDVVVAPSLVIAGTDSRHFRGVAENSFRFLPMRLTREDLARIHGKDERIGVENYAAIVRFYVQLLRNSAG